jgi:hypothetical protein
MAEAVETMDASITFADGTISDSTLVVVAVSSSEVASLLASYSPSSSTSPSATISRDLARVILDALIAAGS